MCTLRCPLAVLLLVIAGCATGPRAVVQPVAERSATVTSRLRDGVEAAIGRRITFGKSDASSSPEPRVARRQFSLPPGPRPPLPEPETSPPSPSLEDVTDEPAVIPIEEEPQQPPREEQTQPIPREEETQQAPQPAQVASPSPDLEDCPELTLEQLESLAFAYNPTLEQARAATWKQRGQYIQAGLYPNPTIGYSASEIGAEGKAGQQGMFFQQEIVTADKLDLNQAVAAWRQQQAQRALTAQEIRVRTAVRREYYAVLAAERMVTLAEQIVAFGRTTLQMTVDIQRAGDASDIDVELSKVELERAELALVRARAERDAAWQRLRAVVGAPNLKPTKLVGDIEATPPDLSPEALWQQITAGSPELAQARAGLARARAAVEAAEAQVIPNITAQAAPMYDFAGEEVVVDVQVGVALPIHDRNQGNIMTAQAEVVRAAREINRREQLLRQRMAAEFQQYEIARAQVERYRDRILPSTARMLDLTEQAQKVQQFSALQTLTVQRTYTEAHQQYVQALRDLWQSVATLEGLLLTDGLADPEAGIEP